MNTNRSHKAKSLRIARLHIPSHVLMILWSLVVLIPVYLLISNALKTKMDMYNSPFGPPIP